LQKQTAQKNAQLAPHFMRALGATRIMSEFRKFLIIAIPFLSLAALVSYCTRETALDFHAEGVVVTAKWNTRNHQLSLFEIKTHTGKVKKLHQANVVLKPEQIKVGDIFKKDKGSPSCLINQVETLCVI
jgi:hypothetical protein